MNPIRMVAVAFLFCFSTAQAQGEADPNPNRDEILQVTTSVLVRAFGQESGDYTDGGLISDQIGEVLGGAPDPEIRLPNGTLFYSACRAHSCNEKAAEVVDLAHRRVLALGLRHHHCRLRSKDRDAPPGGKFICDKDATLTIFTFQHGSELSDAVERIKTWGNSTSIVKVEVINKDVVRK